MATHHVFEYSPLRFKKGLKGYQPWFTARHFQALQAYHDERGGHQYFRLIGSGVQFVQYVGVMQVLDLTLEILPKTDKDEQQSTWHDVLVAMLRQTRKLKLDYLSEASLRFKHHSLLHLYFAEYLGQVNQLLKRGLVKQYRQESGNVLALKGALQFNQHISKNLVHKERFYTRHQVYDQDHFIHQVLRKALEIVSRLVKESLLSTEAHRTLFHFPEVSIGDINTQSLDKITITRKTEPYRKALAIARMIILNYSPDIKGGNQELFALLFDMNKLWEEYLYRQLLKAGVKVRYQNAKQFWLQRRLKPDMVIEEKGETYIMDAKWKVVYNGYPSDEDLRQVFAYNLKWEAKKGFLIYPRTNQSPSDFSGTYKIKAAETSCRIIYVDVLDVNKQLNTNLGSKLKAYLINDPDKDAKPKIS